MCKKLIKRLWLAWKAWNAWGTDCTLMRYWGFEFLEILCWTSWIDFIIENRIFEISPIILFPLFPFAFLFPYYLFPIPITLNPIAYSLFPIIIIIPIPFPTKINCLITWTGGRQPGEGKEAADDPEPGKRSGGLKAQDRKHNNPSELW